MGKIFSAFIYVLLLIICVFSAILVFPAYRKYVNTTVEVSELTERLDRKKAECLALQQEIHDLEHRASATEKVARERFRLCRAGEQIYIYTE